MPTQRSFFAYEATNLIVAAIRRANSDKAQDIERALKTTTVPSLLGRTYAMDDHNHPHTPMQIVGMRNGKPERDGAGWRLRKRLTRRGRLGGLGRQTECANARTGGLAPGLPVPANSCIVSMRHKDLVTIA